MLVDNDLHKNLLDNLTDGVYFVDVNRRITYWNSAAETLTGYKATEVVTHFCWDNILKHINDQGVRLCHTICPLAETIADGCPREAEVYLHHKDGHRVPVLIRVAPIKDSSGQIIGGVEIFSDNSERLIILQEMENLRELALVDTQVQLPNRRYVEQALQVSLDEMRRYDSSFGVLFGSPAICGVTSSASLC